MQRWDVPLSEEAAPRETAAASASSDPRNISSDGHSILIDDMIQAIIDDRDPMITGEEARKSVEIISAIYESMREGKEIVLQ